MKLGKTPLKLEKVVKTGAIYEYQLTEIWQAAVVASFSGSYLFLFPIIENSLKCFNFFLTCRKWTGKIDKPGEND